KGDAETHKPGIMIKTDPESGNRTCRGGVNLDEETRQTRQHTQPQRYHGHDADTAREAIFALLAISRLDIEFAAAPDKIIGDQNSSDGTEQRAVSDQPRKNLTV